MVNQVGMYAGFSIRPAERDQSPKSRSHPAGRDRDPRRINSADLLVPTLCEGTHPLSALWNRDVRNRILDPRLPEAPEP